VAILRYRQIIEHQSPKVRRITDEFTVRNESEDKLGLVLFEFQGGVYRGNLHVLDNDDSELAFQPNDWVKRYLEKVGSPWSKGLLSDLVTRNKAVLVVSLPKDRPLAAMETRVFRLVYTDQEEPDIPYLSLLSTPKFDIKLRPPLEKGYRTQIVVLPPDGFELNLKEDEGEVTGEGGRKTPLKKDGDYHRTPKKAIIDLSLPTRAKTVTFRGAYEVLPDGEEKWLFRIFFWSLTVSSAFVLFSVYGGLTWLGILSGLSSSIVSNRTTLGQALLVSTVGFLGLVTNPLTHRTKLWLTIPVVVSVLILVANK